MLIPSGPRPIDGDAVSGLVCRSPETVRPTREDAADVHWHRLLGRAVSEPSRLCRGDGHQARGHRRRRVLLLAMLRFLHLIACGLIGEPVPPVMTSGGAQ